MTEPAAVSQHFTTEILRFLPDVLRFARALTRDEAEAEDLVQDTYLMAQRAWHQLAPGSDARAWLFTIARHRYYRVHEREGRQVVTDSPELESLAAAAAIVQHGMAIEEEFERRDLRDAVRREMYALPPAYRDAAILVDWHDLSYESAADVLGVPVGTIRSRLFRARRLLQEALFANAEDLGLVSPIAPKGDKHV